MSENPNVDGLSSSRRRAHIGDFLDDNDTCTNYKQNNNIAKNQPEFGDKKQILTALWIT